MTTPTPDPPTEDRRLTTLLAVVGGVLVGLTLVLVVILLVSGDDDGAAATTSTSTTTAETTTTAPTTTTTAPSSTTTAASSTTSSTTTSSSTTTTTTEPFSGDTSAKGTDSSTGSPGALTDVRVGEHAGFTRVVFDFEGSGEHWWTVEYADVFGGGSGEPCLVDGSATMSVFVSPATAFWVSQTYFGPTEFAPDFPSSVEEIKFCDDFEASMQWAIGVDGEKPFDAFVLHDPLRLVIDIQD